MEKKYILFDNDGVLVETEMWYYKASLKALPPVEKLCVACRSSFLKEVVNVDVIAMIISFLQFLLCLLLLT